jgi:hypothetical protein
MTPMRPSQVPGRRHATGSWGSTLALTLGILGLCLVGGVASALGSVLLVGVLAAALVGIGLLMNPKVHLVFGMVFALVVTGVMEFFFFFGQANWLSSLLVGSMLIPAVLRLLWNKAEHPGLTVFGVSLMTYLLLLAASSVINRLAIVQVLVGVRSYLPYIGVAALLVYGGFPQTFLRKLPTGLLVIGLCQLPFALVQQFVVGPWRGTLRNAVGRADEAIVGTFGGSAITGGYTGEMAAFLVMMVVMLLALRREGRISGAAVLLGAVALMVPILLAETKVVFVLLPVLLVVCFAGDMRRKPKFALGLVIGGGILFGAVALTYSIRYWSGGVEASAALGYSFDPDFMIGPGQRGRVGTLVHWFDTNVLGGNVSGAVLGHGIASSVDGSVTLGAGSAVLRYGPGLDTHAMSRLLWDGGALTLAVFLFMCARAFMVSWRLASRTDIDPTDRANLTANAAIALTIFMMTPYQLSSLGGSAMQFLCWFSIGFAEVMRRRLSEPLKQALPARANEMRSVLPAASLRR